MPSLDTTNAEPAGSLRKPKLFLVCRCLGNICETWIWRQLTEIRAFDVHVVTWGYENRDLYRLDGQGLTRLEFDPTPTDKRGRWIYRLRALPGRNFYASLGAERRALARLFEKEKPAVVLCHFGHTALRLLPLAREFKVPLVPHFHGHDLSSGLRNHWYRWSLLAALPHFTRIIVVAPHQRQWMLDHGVEPERLDVIPCGAPVDKFQPAGNVAEQPCRFVSVGRFVEKKAPLNTIRAFAKCAEKCPGITLTMIGTGPLFERAVAFAADLGIAGRIRFLGLQPPERVLEEMQAAGAFVLHCVTAPGGDMEGSPVSIAEAAACALPVVSTRHSSIPLQVLDGQTGLLVEEGDWEGMAEAMTQLAQDPALRQRLGKIGRERMVAQYNLEDQVRQMEQTLWQAIRLSGSKCWEQDSQSACARESALANRE